MQHRYCSGDGAVGPIRHIAAGRVEGGGKPGDGTMVQCNMFFLSIKPLGTPARQVQRLPPQR